MSSHNPDNVSRHQRTFIPDQMWGWKFDEPLETLQAPTLENVAKLGGGNHGEQLLHRLKEGEEIQNDPDNVMPIVEVPKPEEMHGHKLDIPLDILAADIWVKPNDLEDIIEYLLERCRRAESMRDTAKDMVRIYGNEIDRLKGLQPRTKAQLRIMFEQDPDYDEDDFTLANPHKEYGTYSDINTDMRWKGFLAAAYVLCKVGGR